MITIAFCIMTVRKHTIIALLLAIPFWFSCTKKNGTPEVVREEIAAKPVVMAGVNWADARDNFIDGWIIPSGLEADDDYNTVSAKADAVLKGFAANMVGVNTVRLPINPPSVLEGWWTSYAGAIDQALKNNFKVILCCWERASSKDGLVDDPTTFWLMWQVVVNKYQNNPDVYFEIFNEPHGYSLVQLTSVYEEWLTRYPSVPHQRVLLSGTGYSENIVGIGADSRFTNCLLALHNYAFWATRSLEGWEQSWRMAYGSYADRTIVTEYGAGMTTGKNYTGTIGGDNEIAYIVGSTNLFRINGISNVYWPGLRDGDSYSIQTRTGSGNNIILETTNKSGLSHIRYGWGL